MLMVQVHLMEFDFNLLLLLAADEAQKGPSIFSTMLPFFVLAMFLYMMMVVKPDQRERQRKADLLQNLKKNDQVITRFGMYGTVASANAESEDVVIKLEDNARVRIRKTAIEQVLNATPPADEEKK